MLSCRKPLYMMQKDASVEGVQDLEPWGMEKSFDESSSLFPSNQMGLYLEKDRKTHTQQPIASIKVGGGCVMAAATAYISSEGCSIWESVTPTARVDVMDLRSQYSSLLMFSLYFEFYSKKRDKNDYNCLVVSISANSLSKQKKVKNWQMLYCVTTINIVRIRKLLIKVQYSIFNKSKMIYWILKYCLVLVLTQRAMLVIN